MTTTSTATAETLTAPALTGVHHLGLTVRDIEASEAWYVRVLGFVRAFVENHGTGPGYSVVMTHPGTALFLGLDHHPAADQAEFSPHRTGLDHLAFRLADRHQIDEWVARLDTLGVEHGPVIEIADPLPHALVQFRDPDGIALELFWLASA